MKIGVIDVGGGLRGIYAAGVLDACLEEGITFDVDIGVSAGSANIASFAARQKGRNYRFYTEYMARKEYMSLSNFIFKKSYVDMDYVYGTLSSSDGEDPLDYDTLMHNPINFITVALNAATGKTTYFDKSHLAQNNYYILKASSSIPFVCSPYFIDQVPYYDGALGDPVPIEKAFSLGCDHVVLILTKPKDFHRTIGKDQLIASFIRKKYPLAAEELIKRADKYNHEMELAKKYEKQGKVLIIAPDDTCGVDTLTRDINALKKLYEKGIHDSAQIPQFFEKRHVMTLKNKKS